jgi:glucose/arabinose dehydrogenase
MLRQDSHLAVAPYRLGARLLASGLVALLLGCGPASNQPASGALVADTTPPRTAPPTAANATSVAQERQPLTGGPTLLRDDIVIRNVIDTGSATIRLAHTPTDDAIYALNPGTGLYRITLGAEASITQVASTADMVGEAMPAGMAFGSDGTLFVVANQAIDATTTQALIRKGTPTAAGFAWSTLATSEPYPLSGTNFDHLFNGVAVSPDGRFVFVNSGSRTDHGEVQSNNGAFPAMREVPLTARVFRIPTDSDNLMLPNDEARLAAAGLVFARGTRNAYDLAFAPNGELFAADNGPDADYPDELNWLRAGHHYGFPWRFGIDDNPQQFPDYDSSTDRRLSTDFMAVKLGTYHNDPSFPPPPMAFTNPVANRGPAATQYRAADGQQRDAASAGQVLHSFTPHRSPLGLVFAQGDALPTDLRGDDKRLSAFVLSWGAAGGTLTDKGQDLLHLSLTRQGDSYAAVTRQIAAGFSNPIDAVLIANRLYVLDYSGKSTLWELRFE